MERLRDYEQDTLRFMDNERVPFSNNLGENDIRMTKVQQRSYPGVSDLSIVCKSFVVYEVCPGFKRAIQHRFSQI